MTSFLPSRFALFLTVWLHPCLLMFRPLAVWRTQNIDIELLSPSHAAQSIGTYSCNAQGQSSQVSKRSLSVSPLRPIREYSYLFSIVVPSDSHSHIAVGEEPSNGETPRLSLQVLPRLLLWLPPPLFPPSIHYAKKTDSFIPSLHAIVPKTSCPTSSTTKPKPRNRTHPSIIIAGDIMWTPPMKTGTPWSKCWSDNADECRRGNFGSGHRFGNSRWVTWG